MSVISLIQKGVETVHPFAFVIAKVRELIGRNWVVKLSHIYREANRAANQLVSARHIH